LHDLICPGDAQELAPIRCNYKDFRPEPRGMKPSRAGPSGEQIAVPAPFGSDGVAISGSGLPMAGSGIF